MNNYKSYGNGLFSLRLIGSVMAGAFLTWLHVSDYHDFWNTESCLSSNQ